MSLETQAYPTASSGYELLDRIGIGAFATVYAAKVIEGPNENERVAIKVLELDDEETNWDEIRKEIAVMKNLDHPNVVKSYCSFINEVSLWLVMPLLAGGSCADLLKKAFPDGLEDEVLVASILKFVLTGLDYFHQDGKIHRDIKAGNILLAADGGVKIADFGVSGAMIDFGLKREVRKTFTGTPCWMAPEVMEQAKGHNYRADIWSFGITALELAFGRPPYAKYRPMKVMLMILQEDPPSTSLYDDSGKFSSDFKKMVDACLKKDPKERPNAQKLLSMRFFRKAKGVEYIKKKLSRYFPQHGTNTTKAQTSPVVPEGAEKPKPVSVQSFVFDEENDSKHAFSDKKDSQTSSQPQNSEKQTKIQSESSGEGSVSPKPSKKPKKTKGRFTIEEQPDLYGNEEVEGGSTPPRNKSSRFRVENDEVS